MIAISTTTTTLPPSRVPAGQMADYRQKQGGADRKFRRGLEEPVRGHMDCCMTAALASCSSARAAGGDKEEEIVPDGTELLAQRPTPSSMTASPSSTASATGTPLPSFLYAESLGGAIALLIHLRRGQPYTGAVLNGAMCGISDKFKPPWPLEHLVSFAAYLMPMWHVIPTRGSIPKVSFKVEWKRRLALASPRRTVAQLRAATAMELMRVCREVQGRFEEVTMPLQIVHGHGGSDNGVLLLCT